MFWNTTIMEIRKRDSQQFQKDGDIRLFIQLWKASGCGFKNVTIECSIFPLLEKLRLLTAGVEVVLFSLDHTQTQTTVDRIPLEEGSAHRRDLCLITQTLYNANSHAPGGIRSHDPSRRSAADVSLRPRGHCCSLRIMRSRDGVPCCPSSCVATVSEQPT
jgi:hypothetical protein